MPQVAFAELVAAARSGDRLLSFPTDTVPALAIRPDRAELIFAAKQRSQTKPLILMGADAVDLWDYITGSDEERQIWQTVMEQHWPGALTLVLPASDRVPAGMNRLDPTTIGIRVPNRAIARSILAQTGPLATTSVNKSGQPPLETLSEIEAQFPDILTLLPAELTRLEPGADTTTDFVSGQEPVPTSSGLPSTVAKWSGSTWEILRQGSVTL